MTELIIDVPRKLVPALQPARYIALHGGRGGTKSHFFAEKLIERCLMQKTRWACIREVQGSLRESVRQLLIDKIAKFGVEDKFEVLEAEIRCPHGGLIIFKGMQSFNAANLKSLEDFDGAWVEEAQTFSETSLRMLRPTIRKEGSEIWFSWNPRFETDPVDKFFRGGHPPDNAIIINVNWYDNPWFNDTLKAEKDQDYASDPEMAEHVWGGGYERITAGAYFAKHIAALERTNRVGRFPYDPALGPVFTSWDLGVDDYTSIWFAQVYFPDNVPRVRIIDYYEATGLGADDIVRSAMPEYTQDLQERIEGMLLIGRDKPFKYHRHYFPHDIGMREWGAGAKTRAQTVNALGVPFGSIHRGVAMNPEERINAVRQLLPMCEFNQTERVVLGLNHLRRYSRKMNEKLGIYMGPQHDEHSHACLVAGSMVLMGDGTSKPIETVAMGDLVWTPSGNSVILNSGAVKRAPELFVIETVEGKLECTPEHKVLTKRGFLCASQLRASDKILTGRGWASRLISWISMADGIGFRDHIITATTGNAAKARTCTETYGQWLMGKYLKVGTSTTLMGIASTITSTTLRPSMGQSTYASIRYSASQKALSNPLRPKLWRKPLNGIGLTLVASGTGLMARAAGLIENGMRAIVTSVARSITRHILLGLSSATPIVRLEQKHVGRESPWVYDLTVKNHACYQANGLMVSNSDAFGEFAVNAGIKAPKIETPLPVSDDDGIIAPQLPMRRRR